MSLDPSTRGRMDPGEKQYTTNFEIGGPLDGSAIGIVEESASDLLPVGSTVRHRLGWREYAVVDDQAATLCDLAKAPAISWLSSMGQTGFTAYAGLVPVGHVAEGETVLVTGAGGAVGSMAGQFARLMGAGRVIGSAGGAEKCAWLQGRVRLRRRHQLPRRRLRRAELPDRRLPTASTCSSTTSAAGSWSPRCTT